MEENQIHKERIRKKWTYIYRARKLIVETLDVCMKQTCLGEIDGSYENGQVYITTATSSIHAPLPYRLNVRSYFLLLHTLQFISHGLFFSLERRLNGEANNFCFERSYFQVNSKS